MRCSPRPSLCLGLIFLLTCAGCGRPPQIGENKESFKAVDALYTAVSLRETQHLDRCERVIHDLQAKGALSQPAGQSLDDIIAEARGGEWEDAQSQLAAFMRGQRR